MDFHLLPIQPKQQKVSRLPFHQVGEILLFRLSVIDEAILYKKAAPWGGLESSKLKSVVSN